MRNLRFPFEVVRLAPVQWKADESGIAWRGDKAVTAQDMAIDVDIKNHNALQSTFVFDA